MSLAVVHVLLLDCCSNLHCAGNKQKAVVGRPLAVVVEGCLEFASVQDLTCLFDELNALLEIFFVLVNVGTIRFLRDFLVASKIEIASDVPGEIVKNVEVVVY